MPGDDNILVRGEFEDEISRPARTAADAVEEVGEQAEEASPGVLLLERAIHELSDEVRKLNRVTPGAKREIREIGNESTRAAAKVKTLDKETNLFRKQLSGFKRLKFDPGKIMKLYKIPAIITALTLAATAVSSLGAGAVIAVAGLAPLGGLMAAYPGILASVGQGFGAVKMGLGGLGEAIKQLSDPKSDPAVVAESLKGLTQEARDLAQQVAEAKKPFDAMKKSMQGILATHLGPAFKDITGLLPMFRKNMESSADVMGTLAEEAANLFSSKGFSQKANKIMESNNKTLFSLGNAGITFADALTNIMLAAGPMVEELGNMAMRGAAVLDQWTKANPDKMRTFFASSTSVLKETAHFLGQVISGSTRILTIGNKYAGSMGDSMTRLVEQFNLWTKTTQGQKSINQFFKDALPVLDETVRLVGALAVGFSELAQNTSLAPLLKQVRVELLPAILALTGATTEAFGPAMITAATQFVRILNALSFSPLAVILQTTADAASILLDIFDVMPAPIKLVAASFLALAGAIKVVTVAQAANAKLGVLGFGGGTSGVSGMGRVSGGLRGLSDSVRLVAGSSALGVTKLSALRQVTAGGMTKALGGMKTGLGGIVSMLGGPWGIAIIGAVAVLGYFAKKNADAKAKVQAMTEAIKADSGAIGEHSRVLAVDTLTSDGTFKAARDLGIGLKDVTDAALGNAEAQARVNAALAVYNNTLPEASGLTGARSGANAAMSASDRKVAANVSTVTKSLGSNNEALKQARIDGSYENEVLSKQAGAARTVAYQVTALTTAFDKFNGKQVTAAEAGIAWRDQLRGMAEAIKVNGKGLKEGTKAGDANTTMVLGARDALIATTQATFDDVLARKGSTAAAKAANKAWKAGSTALFDQLTQLTGDKEGVDKLRESYFKLPDKWVTDIQVKGLEGALGDLATLGAAILDNTGSVSVAIGTTNRIRGGGAPMFQGGPVTAGTPYTIGEVGPEVFLPKNGPMKIIGGHGPEQMSFAESGMILPTPYVDIAMNEMQAREPVGVGAGSHDGGGSSFTFAPVITGNTFASDIDLEKTVKKVYRDIKKDEEERSTKPRGRG